MTAARTKQERKADGRCTRCDVVLPEDCETVTCPVCAAKSRAFYKAWYERRRKNGGCVYCTKPAVRGLVSCNECIEKRKAFRQEHP